MSDEPKRGRGRPPVYSDPSERRRSKSYSLDPAIIARVEDRAHSEGVDPSRVVEAALGEYLDEPRP